MRKAIIAGAAIAAALAIGITGYRFGAGTWPIPFATQERLPSPSQAVAAAPERNILYWKDPDGKPAYSPSPKKTAAGKDYLPVYDDQEPNFSGAKTAAAPAKGGPRKIIGYKNPMGLPDVSPVPKKDSMGMDYLPMYEGDDDDGSTVKVSLDRVQRSGVRTEAAEMRTLAQPVRAAGV